MGGQGAADTPGQLESQRHREMTGELGEGGCWGSEKIVERGTRD